jgi:hypothetical protein
MRRSFALPALALALAAGPGLAGCSELGIPDIVGSTAGSALDAGDTPATDDPDATHAAEPTPAYFTSNDGYAMTIPPGWAATRMTPDETGLALDLLGAADPTLAALAREVVEATGARVSMVGGDLAVAGPDVIPPGVAVLVVPTDGASDDETEELVAELIGGVPRSGNLAHKVVSLPGGDAHRFELTVGGDTVGPVTLRLFLFSAGSDAVVVAFAAGAAGWANAAPAFESTIRSLRFGV